eukprot:3873608-Pleurochrysis_carterae.AAC.1
MTDGCVVASVQFDNASDNKSRWVIGFCGWLVKKGWVKEVQLYMMIPGHTHEDVDAVFRCIVEYWSNKGVVLNPQAFHRMLGMAIPGVCAPRVALCGQLSIR